MMPSCHWYPEQGCIQEALACYSESRLLFYTLLHFSKIRRDGVMRGLEATESDSFTVTPVELDWD